MHPLMSVFVADLKNRNAGQQGTRFRAGALPGADPDGAVPAHNHGACMTLGYAPPLYIH
jgi:hypothetical protein